jgi:hypothetical protein
MGDCLMYARRSVRMNRGRVREGAGGAAAVWTPASLNGSDLMLEADAGITLNGSNVAAWADQSGSGNHFTHATLQPAYQAAGGPGGTRAAVYFSGTGELDAKRLTGPGFSGAAGEIFIVAKADTDPHAGGGGLQRFGSSAVGAGHTPYTNNLHYLTFGTNTRKDTGVDPGNHANWFLVNWVSAPNDFIARFNRTQYYTTATNTVSWHTSSTLGVDQINAGVWWNGHIAAIYKYSRKLTSDERTLVEGYILTKWGV